MKASILASLFNVDNDWSYATYSCPSGNCKYSHYASLGVCSRCVDLTAQLKRHCPVYANDSDVSHGCEVWLPNNSSLNAGTAHKGNVMHMNIPDESILDVKEPVVTVIDSITAFNTFLVQENTTVVASECALTWCVRSYEASIGSASTGMSRIQFEEKAVHTRSDYKFDHERRDTVFPVPVQPDLGIYEGMTFRVPYHIQQGVFSYVSLLLGRSVQAYPSVTDYEYH